MSKKPSEIIDEETMRRELCTAAYLMARNRKWDLTEEDFTIDENLNFTHATWRGIFCKGGETVVVVFLPGVFPSAVPTFHKQSRKTVLAGVVDVAHHILAARTVTSRGGETGEVGRVGVHGLVVGVVPGALAGHHLPPYTHVLGGVNPRGVS